MAQRAAMDLAEALSLRKPKAASPFAVTPGQPPQSPMPQPTAQMPGMAQGMPFQAPQPISAGMPGMGSMSPYGQPARFAEGGHVSMFAVKRKAR